MKKQLLASIMLIATIACTQKKATDIKPNDNIKNEATTTATKTDPAVTNWMSWEAGLDVAAVTDANLKMPNVIIHIARMVCTPVGNAASGLVLYQPDSTKPPITMGFVSTNKAVGAYFGPKIFAGTPFEKAPVLDATIDVQYNGTIATTKIVTGGHTYEVTATELGSPYLMYRMAGNPMPFYQQGVELKINKAIVKVDGKEIKTIIPPVGISGGPGAVVSPNGVYAR